ncbi:MAG: hypothetical protein WB347_11695 [Terriglobales bacterium]
MLKRVLTIVLCGLLFETMLAADAWALQPAGSLASRQAARVKSAVARVGTGTDAVVAVRLRDKSVVSGWISGVGPDSFRVTDPQTNSVATVRFLDVSRLAGANLVSGDTAQYGGGIGDKLAKVANLLVPGRHPTSNGFANSTLLIIGIAVGILIAIVVAKTV